MLRSCMTDGTNHKTASRRCSIILLLPLPPPSSGFVEPSSLISAASGGRGGPAILRPFRFKLLFYFFSSDTSRPEVFKQAPPPRPPFLILYSFCSILPERKKKKRAWCNTHTQIESTCHTHGPAWVCVCVHAAGWRVCLQLTWCHSG